ncbi:hypothetical protein N9Y80_00615 [Porticoccaceae bacterium]|jgi:hypothetical protein|nr:hypothetical protein [Porticoccaceae bacterium]
MFNYQMVATLLLMSIVVFPIAIQWALEPTGHWIRPFLVWGLMVFSAVIFRRERKKS